MYSLFFSHCAPSTSPLSIFSTLSPHLCLSPLISHFWFHLVLVFLFVLLYHFLLLFLLFRLLFDFFLLPNPSNVLYFFHPSSFSSHPSHFLLCLLYIPALFLISLSFPLLCHCFVPLFLHRLFSLLPAAWTAKGVGVGVSQLSRPLPCGATLR